MLFTLNLSSDPPAGAVVAGVPVPPGGGVRVEAAGGFHLTCTGTDLIVEPSAGGTVRVRTTGDGSVPGGPCPERPVLGFTVGNGTDTDLVIAVEWTGIDVAVPPGATVRAAWMGEPLGAGPDPWRDVCEIAYEPGVLQLWETARCALLVAGPDGSVLETLGARDGEPVSLRGLAGPMLRALGVSDDRSTWSDGRRPARGSAG